MFTRAKEENWMDVNIQKSKIGKLAGFKQNDTGVCTSGPSARGAGCA